jgi:hypothetical protein
VGQVLNFDEFVMANYTISYWNITADFPLTIAKITSFGEALTFTNASKTEEKNATRKRDAKAGVGDPQNVARSHGVTTMADVNGENLCV